MNRLRASLVVLLILVGKSHTETPAPSPQPVVTPATAPATTPQPAASAPATPPPVVAPPPATPPPQTPAATLSPAIPVTPATTSSTEYWTKTMNESWFSLGFSPIYKPKSSQQLGSSLKMDFDLSIRTGLMDVGFRYARGTVGHLFLSDNTIALNAIHQIWCLYMQPEIPLYAPYQSLGPIMPFIPIFLGINANIVSARLVHYYNMGFDVGTGVGAHWFVSDKFSVDLTGLYHIGIPISPIRESSVDDALTGPGGEAVGGATTGFEIRLALSFMTGP